MCPCLHESVLGRVYVGPHLMFDMGPGIRGPKCTWVQVKWVRVYIGPGLHGFNYTWVRVYVSLGLNRYRFGSRF